MMTKEQLQKIADDVGLEPVEAPTTLTFKNEPPMEVFAMGWDGPDLWVLNTSGQVWTFRGAYATKMERDEATEGVVEVTAVDLKTEVPNL